MKVTHQLMNSFRLLKPSTRFGRQVLSLVISMQLGIGFYVPAVSAQENGSETTEQPLPVHPEDPRAAEMLAFQREIEQSTETTFARIPDPFHLKGQTRVRFGYNKEGVLGIVEKIPLDRYQIQLAADVGVSDLDRQMRPEYSPREKAFYLLISTLSGGIKNLMKGKQAGQDDQMSLSYGHRFEDLALSAPLERAVIQDANFMLIATETGVEALFLGAIEKPLLRASIPRFTIGIPPNKLVPGAKIVQLEFVNKDSKLQGIRGLDNEDLEYVLDHDVIATIALPDGTYDKTRLDYGKDIVEPIAPQVLYYLLQLQVANPNLDLLPQILEVAKDLKLQKYFAKHDQLRESILTANQDEKVPSSDLIHSTLVAASQRTDINGLFKLLKRDAFGRNSFEQTASYPRDRVIVDHSVPREVLTQTWAEQLVQTAINPDKKTEAVIEEGEQVERAASQHFAARILNVAKRVIEPSSAMLLGAAVAGDLAILQTGGPEASWILSSIGHYMSWALDVPVIGPPLQDAVKSQFFHEHWALTRFAVGVAAFASLRPALYMVAKWKAQKAGYNWSERKAFFTYGLRFCALSSYPFQAPIWWKIFRQKNLYKALLDGLKVSTPGVLNSWTQSSAGIQGNQEKINTAVQDDAVVKQRALLTAAAILSQKSSKSGNLIDPVFLLELFTADHVGKMDTLLNSIGSEESEKAWLELLYGTVYKAYATMDHSQPVDEKLVGEYVNVLQPLVDKFFAQQEKSQNASTAVKWAKTKFNQFAKFTSKQVVPYLLFGQQGYHIYLKYKNAVIDERSAHTAASQYDMDYPLGNFLYGLGIPHGYGLGTLRAFIEATMNQAQQPIIYGVLNGLNAVQTHEGHSGLSTSAFEPSVYEELNRSVPIAKGGAARELSLKESLAVMGRSVVDISDPASVIKTQIDMMTGIVSAFQVRVLSSVAPWVLGMVALQFFPEQNEALKSAEAAGFIGMTTAAFSAIPKYSVVWLDKYSYTNKGVGYAWPWVLITAFTNAMKNRAEANLVETKNADYLLDEGLKYKNKDTLLEGIFAQLRLYAKGDGKLSEELMLPDVNNAKELLDWPLERLLEYGQKLKDHSVTQPALATVMNDRINDNMNLSGAVVTTIFYVTFTNAIIGGSLGTDLAVGLGTFATYLLGFKGAFSLDAKIRSVAAPIVEKVKNAIAPKIDNMKAAIGSHVKTMAGDQFHCEMLLTVGGSEYVDPHYKGTLDPESAHSVSHDGEPLHR